MPARLAPHTPLMSFAILLHTPSISIPACVWPSDTQFMLMFVCPAMVAVLLYHSLFYTSEHHHLKKTS